MSTTDGKPDAKLREEVLKDDVIVLDPKRVLHLHTKTLLKAEEYYQLVLETLCGTQVWTILDCMAAIEEELKSRKKPYEGMDFDQVKSLVFAEMDRNAKGIK